MAYLTKDTDTRGVTTLTLNRPDNFNALDRAFIDELTATVNSLDSKTRILVISANGKHFCAGADINWMKASVSLSDEQNREDAMAFSNMLNAVNSFDRPTLARIHGAALGGGTGLACCCDIVVASDSAQFAFSEVKLGIIPATISPYSIAAIGSRAARRYFLTGERIDSNEAHRLGLVHDVCALDDLDSTLEEHIKSLLSASSQAQIEAKRLIADVTGKDIDLPLRTSLGDRLATIRASKDAQEGLSAFLEKRPANW
ncbi:enoyl-CoA hydratase-related protein [Granulosicoccus sp.]|nr:enoyl-CoA hydratase-related protein [Granulosicoccus sp.]MDB4223457.1 enoyl-CoA hydratase-related protein [Granulosicoccus sp.]